MSAPPALRIVGPPASGKTLLIVSLTEALRQRGRRVASSAPRGEGHTVVTLPNGARVSIERTLTLDALRALVASLDPRVDLLLAEGCDDPGAPAVELSPVSGEPRTPPAGLLAVVSSTQLAGDFAQFGPGETRGLADLVEARLLGSRTPAPVPHEARRDAGRKRWWQRRRAP